jgi:transcriptional regulator with XRE-family HTH domain
MIVRLGELMQERLAELGWSQAELARRLRRSPTHVGNLLNDVAPGTKSGKRKQVALEDCDRIALVMAIPRDLVRRAGGWFVDDKPITDVKAARLQSYFDGLSTAAQDDAVALLEALWKRHGDRVTEEQSVPVPSAFADYTGPGSIRMDDDDMEGKFRKDDEDLEIEKDDVRRALEEKPQEPEDK